MKHTALPLFLCAFVMAIGCSKNGGEELPSITVDYGYGDNGDPDVAVPDADPVDQNTTRDEGGNDVVDTQETPDIVDVVEDTGPCTLVCTGAQRCGPNPCGDGECLPGCKENQFCNLLTGTCVAKECEPNCTGRECGSNGCAGFCGPSDGKCGSGLYCNYTTGKCGTTCNKSCVNKLCGDDGCGGICAPGCQTGIECKNGVCVNEGTCKPSSTELYCEAEKNSASGDTSWSIGTTTSALFNYSEACGSAYNPAPEKAYKLVVGAGLSGTLSVTLSQTFPFLSDFLSIYMIEDTGSGCVAASCVTWGADGFTYDVPASATGHTYYLVVDTDQMNNGLFTLTINSCSWNQFQDTAE